MSARSHDLPLPETAVVVPGFIHHPGRHCASTALANVARWNGLSWSEAFCFGLGAGVGFTYVESNGLSPSRFIMPRSAALELTFLEMIGLPQQWRQGGTPGAAWESAQAEVAAGRPVLLLTDLYYQTGGFNT